MALDNLLNLKLDETIDDVFGGVQVGIERALGRTLLGQHSGNE